MVTRWKSISTREVSITVQLGHNWTRALLSCLVNSNGRAVNVSRIESAVHLSLSSPYPPMAYLLGEQEGRLLSYTTTVELFIILYNTVGGEQEPSSYQVLRIGISTFFFAFHPNKGKNK